MARTSWHLYYRLAVWGTASLMGVKCLLLLCFNKFIHLRCINFGQRRLNIEGERSGRGNIHRGVNACWELGARCPALVIEPEFKQLIYLRRTSDPFQLNLWIYSFVFCCVATQLLLPSEAFGVFLEAYIKWIINACHDVIPNNKCLLLLDASVPVELVFVVC